MRPYGLVIPVLLAALAACATPPCGNGICPLGGGADTHANLDAVLHDYILAHGDVVLQALQDNQKKQQAARLEQAGKLIAENRAALFEDPRDLVAGNPKGDVTVVEFYDNRCPYCKKVAPDLEKLIAADKGVRVVYKEFPILGPVSRQMAAYALASRAQGKYAAYHDALMADPTLEQNITEETALSVARKVGLDLARLKTDMAAPEIQAQIDATIALARKIGITGTPGIIVGDRLTSGAMTFEALQMAVTTARAHHSE